MLSQKALNLKPSPTLSLVAKAKELKDQGHDVISLTVGEPDWATFEVPSKAGIEAIQKNITKYTAAAGTIELRKVIAQQLEKDLGVKYTPSQVAVASGAKYTIFAALQMLCDAGDEVIIPAPYWVSYPTMVELAGGIPRIVDTSPEDQFKITPHLLEKYIHSKTKAFLFCSPSNPTGISYTAQELEALAKVLRLNPQVVILSDDIYNRLNFDGSKVAPHILQVAPDLADRTFIINGGSKGYSMTGWRIGWGAGPQKLVTAIADFQSQSTGSPSSISQYAVLAALQHCDKDIEQVVQKLIQRRDVALEEMKTVPAFKVAVPQGAFYLWVDIRATFGKKFQGQTIQNSKDFCAALLEKFYVATVPGIECGTEGYMRLSFAVSSEDMKRAIARMKDLVGQLQ